MSGSENRASKYSVMCFLRAGFGGGFGGILLAVEAAILPPLLVVLVACCASFVGEGMRRGAVGRGGGVEGGRAQQKV